MILLLSGCDGPLSMLAPAGPSARTIALLWWGMFGFFTLVFVVVVALWLYAQHRRPRAYAPEAARRVGRRWVVGGGLLLPGASIAVLLAFGMPAGLSLQPLPGADPLRIEVIGHQWWWEVRYPHGGVTTANQMVIPAGRAVDLHLRSADVIHSFWVPRLAGKMDMLPGVVTVLRLQADETGHFLGHCAEFCGAQHARMQLVVEARPPDEFDAWIGSRRRAPSPPAPEHAAAVEAFQGYCGHCHQVAGVSEGRGAPDLSDVGSRPTLGAGTLARTPQAMRRWLHEHQRLKPDNHMPSHDHLAPHTLDAIADWLETLAP